MHRVILEDFAAILQGLNKIVKASSKIQKSKCKQIWYNSSIKEMTEDLSNINNTQRNCKFQDLSQTLERTSMIYEGIKAYSSSSIGTIHNNENNEKITMEELRSIDEELFENNKSSKTNSIKEKLNEENCNLDSEKNHQNMNKNNYDSNTSSNSFYKKPKSKDIVLKKVSINESAKQSKVPASRIGRLTSFGTLVAGLGIGTLAEITRRALRISQQQQDNFYNPLLNEANAERIVNTLCKVRGAALKIGQILSIQDNNIIHPSLQKAFERVRQSADFMPTRQIEKVLSNELGQEWRSLVLNFEMKPFAAASIGQVHFATLLDNREVAIKIQYPGVAKSIESDIDNLVGILKLWDFFPPGMFIDNLVEVAKRELAWEVDYIREADCTKKFKQLLEPYPEYMVPDVIDNLTNQQIFTTEFVEGIPIDKCSELDEETRTYIGYLMIRLVLLELFEFQYMQTDPNWSNFLYNPKTQQLVLLDFGASRSFSKEFMDVYIEIIKAAADKDRKTVLTLSKKLGFLTGYEQKVMEESHIDAVMILGEIFQSIEPFDFAVQKTTKKIQQLVPTMVKHRLCPPPEEIYSLHRKLSGVFLLCSKLKVKLQCRPIFEELYSRYKNM